MNIDKKCRKDVEGKSNYKYLLERLAIRYGKKNEVRRFHKKKNPRFVR